MEETQNKAMDINNNKRKGIFLEKKNIARRQEYSGGRSDRKRTKKKNK